MARLLVQARSASVQASHPSSRLKQKQLRLATVTGTEEKNSYVSTIEVFLQTSCHENIGPINATYLALRRTPLRAGSLR
jgi:hypothetical protein